MTNKNIILTLKLSPNTKPTISNADLTKFVSQVKGLSNLDKVLFKLLINTDMDVLV